MEKDIRLISLDVDDTLVDSQKNIPPENMEAIRWAHFEKGVHITINSGRISASVRRYMEMLGVHEPYPSLGGAVINYWDGSVLEENFVERETALKINAIARSLGCADFVYNGGRWFLDPGNDFWVQSEFRATGIMGNVTDTDTVISEIGANKLLGVNKDPEKILELEKLISGSFGSCVDCFRSSPMFLEILPKGINKGSAVLSLCRYYGIKGENVMSIGDFYNDIDMFKVSGVAVAMANAPSAVKEYATCVTEKNNSECGVAEAVYRFVN